MKGSSLHFTLFICFLSVVGLSEYYRMTLPERPLYGLLAAFAGGVLPYLLFLRSWQVLLFCITCFVFVGALYFLFRFDEIGRVASEAGVFVFGLLYVPLLLGYLVLLRNGLFGLQWTFLILFIIMPGDSAAYYLGCRFGRHKLYPAVSPNKSVEGAISGLAGSLVGTFVAKALFFPELQILHAIVAALLIGSAGQIGDLFESLIKRSCGVKDSGVMVPGHGGILDRLDSILFAAPVAYLLSVVFF